MSHGRALKQKAKRSRGEMAGGGGSVLVVVCVVLQATGGVCEVLELTDSSFQGTVNEAELAAVVFHAPWSARRLHYTNATSSSTLKSLLNTYKGGLYRER